MKIKCLIIMLLIFNVILFSGCISPSEFSAPPTGPSKHPNSPVIGIDNKENAYIMWEIYDLGKYYLKSTIIDTNETKAKEKNIIQKTIGFPKLIKDSTGDFYLFFVGSDESLGYLKINGKSELIMDTIIISKVYNGEHGSFDTSKLFDVTIDRNDNLHVLYFTTNFTTSYVKLDRKGDILESQNLGKFIVNITFTLKMVDFSFYVAIDYYNVIWAIWLSGGKTYNTNTNVIKGVNKTLSGNAIKVDTIGDIHLLSGSNYKKISGNGTLLISENINNITKIPKYPVIKDDAGNYIYLNDNGYVDNENNIHIVTDKVETKVWESGRNREEYDFYTIYYSKIDKDGTILIDKLIIDTDGEPSWENGENSIYSNFLILLIAIPILVIILIAIILYSKKYKLNRSK